MPATHAIPVSPAPLGDDVEGWFTGARPATPDGAVAVEGRGSRPANDSEIANVSQILAPMATAGAWQPGMPGHPSNLSHRRPHRPVDLVRARRAVGAATATDPESWHLMHQVHGSRVGAVEAATPIGAEMRQVDALVTTEPDRVLAVTVADCVPLLLAGRRVVAAVHAGRAGLVAGVVTATLDAVRAHGETVEDLRAVLGPAIGGCCYEVPAAMHEEVAAQIGATEARTTWGTPALDLPAGVVAQLTGAGVSQISCVGGCTRCQPGWLSHRADPTTGRMLGLVVRRGRSSRPSGSGERQGDCRA